MAAIILSLVPGEFDWSLVWKASLIALIGASVILVLRVVQRNRRMLYVKDLLSLSPTGFEEAMVDLFRDLGFRQVKRTGGAGDLAADITCDDTSGRRVVIQCKRYGPDNHVGSPVVQAFIGMITVHHKADYGVFITTSSFTAAARDLAKAHGITLYDGETLADLVQRARAGRTHDAFVQRSLTSV